MNKIVIDYTSGTRTKSGGFMFKSSPEMEGKYVPHQNIREKSRRVRNNGIPQVKD